MNEKPGRDPREEGRPHDDVPESARIRDEGPGDDQPHDELPEGDQPADEQSEEARRALASYSSIPKWMFFGLIIGGGFGVIMDNMPLGVGAGLAIGALIGFFRNGSEQP